MTCVCIFSQRKNTVTKVCALQAVQRWCHTWYLSLWASTVGDIEFTVGRYCGGYGVHCGKGPWGMLSSLWASTVGDVEFTVGRDCGGC